MPTKLLGFVGLLVLVAPCRGVVSVAASSHSSHSAMAVPPPLGNVRFIHKGLAFQPPHRRLQRATLHQSLYAGYFLRTVKNQKASLRFRDGSLLHMNQQTDAVLRSVNVTYVAQGDVLQVLAKGTHHEVRTPVGVAISEGTKYIVSVRGKVMTVIVLEGAVQIKNGKGQATLGTNQQVVVQPGQAPGPVTPIGGTAAGGWASPIPGSQVPQAAQLDVRLGTVSGDGSNEGTVTSRLDLGYASVVHSHSLAQAITFFGPRCPGSPCLIRIGSTGTTRAGNLNLWIYVRETRSRGAPYVSGPQHFRLMAGDGSVVEATSGAPHGETPLTSALINGGIVANPKTQNEGFIQFEIPALASSYQLQWNPLLSPPAWISFAAPELVCVARCK